jgi:hypothetical protein
MVRGNQFWGHNSGFIRGLMGKSVRELKVKNQNAK